jgi:hypothetical protein
MAKSREYMNMSERKGQDEGEPIYDGRVYALSGQGRVVNLNGMYMGCMK